MRRKFFWTKYPDEQLLRLRLKDLKVTVEGTWLEYCVRDLYNELDRKGLRIRPHTWISEEWFSSNISPGIAIPFYLTHPRLMQLERKMMKDVDGGTAADCMRILRHEAGHVIQESFQLHRRRRWQKLFGRSSKRYPTRYRPNPASKNHVQHLPLWYAQSHPDEDFAETFAVWLQPRSNWRKRYADWPALKKLQYVDELMAEIARERPPRARKLLVDPLTRDTRTLAQYYEKKRARYSFDRTKSYDRDLLRIFSADPKHRQSQSASTFIRNNRARFTRSVLKWTGGHQLTIDAVLDDMIARCRELKLRAVGSERQLRADFSLLLTANTMRALSGRVRRQWFAL